MRIVVQRCSRAEVRIDGRIVGQIGQGFMLLVGITENDTKAEADLLAKKIAQLRVFEDPEGKIHLMMSYTGIGRDVADPWYTGDFEVTFRDLLKACEGLLGSDLFE